MHSIESDPYYLDGIRLFNERRFWDSHESIEQVWKTLPRDLPERRLLQSLILLAAAFLHRERARTSPGRSVRPALRCAGSALAKLEGLPDGLLGLDLGQLSRAAVDCFLPLECGHVPDDVPPPPTLTLRKRPV